MAGDHNGRFPPKTPLITTTLSLTLIFTTTFTFATPPLTSSSDSSEDAQEGCEYGSVLHLPGSTFKAGPCTRCHCSKRGGLVSCVAQDCATERHCLRYQDRKEGEEEECCPRCLEMGCRHTDEKIYQQGEVIRNEPCVRCYCPLGGGEPVCDVTSCPKSECVDPVQIPGVCCKICPNGPNCQIGLHTFPIGQSVIVDGATCTCENYLDQDGNKRMLARCNKEKTEPMLL